MKLAPLAAFSYRLSVLDAAMKHSGAPLSILFELPGFLGAFQALLRVPPALEPLASPAFVDRELAARFQALDGGPLLAAVPEAQRQFGIVLREQLGAARCSVCAPSRPCAGADPEADERNLEDRGLCIQPLREMFDYALGLARRSYGNLIAPQATLRVDFIEANPNPPVAVPLQCVTLETGDGPQGMRRQLVLELSVDAYEVAAYLGTPYILFHECFSHVFSGVPLGGPRARLGAAFSEGWMDWVGLQVLKRDLRSGVGRKLWLSLADEIGEAARSLGAHGIAVSRSPEACLHRQGALAAQRLKLLFDECEDDHRKGTDLLIDFSHRFNASSADHARRGLLVACLMNLLADATDPYDAVEKAPRSVGEAVRRFKVERDSSDLVDKIVEFS